MSESSTASIDREPGTARTDAERITEAGITDALVECLREQGYGEYELAREPQLVVTETRHVTERTEEEGRQVFLLPTDTYIALSLKRPGDEHGRSGARFYYEDPYPGDSHRKPFFMLREYESSVEVAEPEKVPSLHIISASLNETQVRLIENLTREYLDEIGAKLYGYKARRSL